MSSTAAEEIELLERVLLRLGVADTDEKLEATVGRFLTPVIIKISSPHDNVRAKVVEVLTHIKRRVTSRPLVQIPVEALLDQYKASGDSPFLQNFVIIFITMGFPRLPIEKQTELAAKLISCEKKLENYQDKLFMLLLPLLNEIKLPSDPVKKKQLLDLDDKPEVKKKFLDLLKDVLLVPYNTSGPFDGLSPHSVKRITANNWKAEELEKIKQGIVRFICSGIFSDLEVFILLVIASSDTRFSVATPAIAELSKVCTVVDFGDPHVTEPLYVVFSGNNAEDPELKVSPSCSRVRQKILQYLIKARGKGIDVPRGIQVIFQALFEVNSNQKCRVLALQFCEKMIKDGPIEIISKISKVLLTGLMKLISPESGEPVEVLNGAYSTLAQLARTCPGVINQDLKIVLSFFNHLASAQPELQGSIREALVSIAPAFACNTAIETDHIESYQLDPVHHLLLAMLNDKADTKITIVQNVISVFLTTCFPEHFPPARLLLLLIAGERNSLREAVTSYLYGVSKRDQVNYNYLSSIDHPEGPVDDFNKLSSEQRRVVLPSFKSIVRHVTEMSKKRLSKSSQYVVVGKTKLPVSLNVYEEILNYLRVCLWFSAGVKGGPGDEKNTVELKNYIVNNFEQNEENEVFQYLQLVQLGVEAQRNETNLLCLYDLLNAAPEVLCKAQMHLMDSLSQSLKEVSEVTRLHVSQVYGILLAYGFDQTELDAQIAEILSSLPQKSLENRHGWLMVLGHAYSRRIESLKSDKEKLDFSKSTQFIESVKLLVKMFCESQTLLVSAAIKGISMIGRTVPIPDFEVEIPIPKKNNDDDDAMDEDLTASMSTKYIIFGVIFQLIRNSSVKASIRQDAVKCLGSLAIGDGEHFTTKNLEKFMSLVKVQKDVALNIAISEAIVATINGFHPDCGPPCDNFVNKHCDEQKFETFLNSLIKVVPHPNPHSRQSSAVWLLAIVKHCSSRPSILAKKQLLQYAFTELLSDDSEFIQDVASRGLGLVYSLSDSQSQNDLANSLLDQLIGGKRKVNQVAEDTELFPEGMLGKAPTGGNITTYKELCSLASDLNQPEMIYQFMQLANHNAVWTSKLGAAFGLKSISKDAKAKLQPYLGKIIPRLYRYKYDPTPKIQNSMISIWDSIVTDSKAIVEQYYWEIFKEILDNLTFNEWRVRIACCLAVRDLLRRPTGLRLRSEEKKKANVNAMEVDGDVPEPELKELWLQLIRVMDDIHEGTRLAAQGTVNILSKICVTASSSDHGKSGVAVATSILPLLLEIGVPHTVADIRKVSIQTISEMIDSSGSLIAPHLPTLIPCLLKATGELESSKLSYMSTRLGAETEAQEVVDSIRAEAAKSHRTMETTAKCIQYIDYAAMEKMTPDILELVKVSVNMGTKIACAHFICLISIRLGKEMTPLVGKYLGACFTGLKDRNATVRKYYASAIGHLVGIAKEQSIKNLFGKLDELYTENSSNRAIVLTIQSINKRHNELLKDYTETVLPLIFFAMHEEVNEENKSTVELWKDIWNEVSPGDAGIRLNLKVIIPKLERSLDDSSWLRKAQSANAINTIATRLSSTLEEADRLKLINMLLVALQGRTFQGKERLLQAVSALCKGLNKEHAICEKIIDAAFRECKKEEPQYRTLVLSSLGDILEELEVDRFEEVYNMIWYILDKKDLKNDDEDDDMTELNADQRNKRAHIFNKLKETVCETLGKSWPKNSEATQDKFQIQFAERCSQCLKDNTRPVQVSLMVALTKFVERLKIFDPETAEGKEKKPKVESSEALIVQKICTDVLAAVTYASSLPHTGLKKESLNIVLVLIKKLTESHNETNLSLVRNVFEESLQRFEKDSAPEVRCRIKDIEDKLSKVG